MNFEDAISDFDYGNLPVFFQKIAVDNFFSDCEVELSNMVLVPLSQHDQQLVPVHLVKATLTPQVRCCAEQRKPYAIVTLFPFVKDASGNVRKLVSCEITLTPHADIRAEKARLYASNSVLSSGLWYKVAVQETGLYKLTFENLVAMGL